jgi:hypothetical protein
MFKWSLSLLCLAALAAGAPAMHAQAVPTATGGAGAIQVGAGVLLLDPDYNPGFNKGLTGYADYDFMRHVGVEAEVHFGGIISPYDISENSYLVGPRFKYRRGKSTLYGKLMFGEATIKNQNLPSSSTNFNSANGTNFGIYAFGGGIEYRIKRHYNLRGDIEEQKWGNFEPHTLSPIAITIGVAYTFH